MGDYNGIKRLKPFMRYVIARNEEYIRDMAYRIYVTDALMLAPQHKYINQRFYDRLSLENKVEDTRTGDEIVADIMRQNGLRFEEKKELKNGTS